MSKSQKLLSYMQKGHAVTHEIAKKRFGIVNIIYVIGVFERKGLRFYKRNPNSWQLRTEGKEGARKDFKERSTDEQKRAVARLNAASCPVCGKDVYCGLKVHGSCAKGLRTANKLKDGVR